MCGRPLGCKRKNEKSDGRIDCDHVSGLLARQHGRWPRWVPRSSPKQARGLEAETLDGVSGSSVRPIVISFSSFTPASTRAPAALGGYPFAATRVIATHAVWAIPFV